MIENLFYNVATRRKALSSMSEEFNKITDVVTKYAIHNPAAGFVLKKYGEITPQVFRCLKNIFGLLTTDIDLHYIVRFVHNITPQR